jgi:hypothetical protein
MSRGGVCLHMPFPRGRHTFESRFHDEELQGESVAVFTG